MIVVYPTIINQEFYKFFLAKKQQIFYRFKPHPEVKLRECIFSYTLFRCKCEVEPGLTTPPPHTHTLWQIVLPLTGPRR
jgi:hypothetical protein